MAATTGIVVAAGGITLLDIALTGWEPGRATRVAAATVLAALVSAGLDKAIPGLGTAGAVLLLVAAVMTSGPVIAKNINLVDPNPGKIAKKIN